MSKRIRGEVSCTDCNLNVLCSVQLPLEKKIEIIAKEIYGADGIELLPEAQKRLELFKKQV